jgi:hypothetical protein
MTAAPLAELRAHLARDGAVPLAWVVAHAPDGDLRRVWGRGCTGLPDNQEVAFKTERKERQGRKRALHMGVQGHGCPPHGKAP